MSDILPYDIFANKFSNFSAHMLEYRDVLYTTAEHAYHAQRYTDPVIIEKIKNSRSATAAWAISQQYKKQQNSDFDEQKIQIMEDIFREKLKQHEDVKQALIDSGDLIIVKNADDYFWGIGADGSGKNIMGQLWMKLRKELLGK